MYGAWWHFNKGHKLNKIVSIPLILDVKTIQVVSLAFKNLQIVLNPPESSFCSQSHLLRNCIFPCLLLFIWLYSDKQYSDFETG